MKYCQNLKFVIVGDEILSKSSNFYCWWQNM